MKILLGSSLYEPNIMGGAERVVQLLAHALKSRGHEVAVITTQPSGPAARAMIKGITVHYVPVKNIYRPFSASRPGALRKLLWRAIDSYNPFMNAAVGKILELEKPDVLNTHSLAGFSVAILAEAKRRGIPVVHTLHDQYLLCHRSTMFRPPRNCTSQCLDCKILTVPRKHFSCHVDGAIGVSEFILKRHSEYGHFRGQPSTLIYNTSLSTVPTFTNRPAASTAFRFGFLGQIIPTKGVRELINAFRFAQTGGAELWIAGKLDSEYALGLQAATQGDTRIRWLGYADADEFFCNIDVLVVPSTWNDTAPLVVYEAFSHGVPVLGSLRGGIPELIPPDCGWLMDPDDPVSLSTGLAECVSAAGRMQDMRRACFQKAQHVSREPWAEKYIDAFHDAIKTSAHQQND